MSSENLRFSVEESVWFQKGQEVSELLSISLDPDIVIQEHDQYVSIRGALQLTGEYRIDENASEEEERDFTSVRLVNEVVTREDGISELNHRFPVDITIPQNRIQHLDEVYVSIEAFDYEIPKRGCLQIIADLSISGIQGVSQAPKQEHSEKPTRAENTTVDTPAVTEDVPVAQESPSEEVPVVQEPPVAEKTHEEEPELELVRSSSFDDEDSSVAEDFDSFEEEVVLQGPDEVALHTEEDEVEEVRDEASSTQEEPDSDLFVPFEVEARKEAYQEPEQEVVVEAVQEEEEAAVFTPQIEVKARHDNKLTFGSNNRKVDTVTAIEEREVEDHNEETVKRSENELLLTKIFGRDEVEDHTTMKICIVQNGDSLEKIAERYDISVQQLVRVNSLNTDSVSEGQLLYIPIQVNM